jgi:hypothetical protein
MLNKGFIKKHKYSIAALSAVIIAAIVMYRARVVAFAKQWVGISERGVNAGFSNNVFQAMLKRVGWKSGESWCMYFAKAVHYDSFPKDRAVINRLLNGRTQESFNNVLKDNTNTYRIITSGRPRLGDIAIWQNTNNRSTGHAGIVIKSGTNEFTTVEGNTNQAGSREGDMVLQKTRPLTYGQTLPNSTLMLRGFIRKVHKII